MDVWYRRARLTMAGRKRACMTKRVKNRMSDIAFSRKMFGLLTILTVVSCVLLRCWQYYFLYRYTLCHVWRIIKWCGRTIVGGLKYLFMSCSGSSPSHWPYSWLTDGLRHRTLCLNGLYGWRMVCLLSLYQDTSSHLLFWGVVTYNCVKARNRAWDSKEIAEIIDSCSEKDAAVLLEILRASKVALEKHK